MEKEDNEGLYFTFSFLSEKEKIEVEAIKQEYEAKPKDNDVLEEIRKLDV